jgi:hypothetical protein
MYFKPKILSLNDIDVNQITFCDFKKKGHDNYLINLKYEDRKIYLQTPYMQTPFGITDFTNDNIRKYCLNISFFGNKFSEEIEKMKDIFTELDEMIYDNFIDNEEWLEKSNLTNDEVKEAQVKTIKESGNNFPDYLNLKLLMDYKKGEIKTKFFDDNRKEVKINPKTVSNIIPPKSYVKSIIEITGIWVYKKKFGVSLQPKQFLIKPNHDYYFNKSLFN